MAVKQTSERKKQIPLSGCEVQCYLCKKSVDTSLARYIGQDTWRCEDHTDEDILRGSRYAYVAPKDEAPEIVWPKWWRRVPKFCRDAWRGGIR